MHRGYIKLWRKCRDNPLWSERRTYSRWEAWEDLLLEAHWDEDSPKKILIKGKSHEVFYSQVLWSVRFMANRWLWSKSKVSRFIEWLKGEEAITVKMDDQKSGQSVMRITICNYKAYHPERDSKRDTGGTLTGQNKRSKEVKNKKTIVHDEGDFERFWSLYPPRGVPPSRQKRTDAEKAFRSASKEKDFPGVEALIQLLEEAKKCQQWTNPRYIPMAATWLRSKPWNDGEQEQADSSGSPLLEAYYKGQLEIKPNAH